MKKVKLFYLENCPHCKRAFNMIEDIKASNPKFKNVEFEYIEESKDVQIASAHDYYYVPTFYVNGVKIHEGVPSVEKITEVLDKAIM